MTRGLQGRSRWVEASDRAVGARRLPADVAPLGSAQPVPVRAEEPSSVAKIKVEGPVVELDGDEMTRIIWQFIKDR